jgi:hypothetical protein
LKPGLHMADSSMAFGQNLTGCLPISRSEWGFSLDIQQIGACGLA